MNEVQILSWQAPGLTTDEREMLNDLLLAWQTHLARNQLRHQYYNMHNKLKDLGIAIPPPLKNIDTVLGWPAKCVDYLADRSIFEGFRTKKGLNADLDEILDENDFDGIYYELKPSMLISSPAFVTVTKGGEGDPDVLISAYDARTASAIWDYRRRRIKCGMAIVDYEDRHGVLWPTQLNLFTEDKVIEIIKRDWIDKYDVIHKPHSMGRPLIEALRFRPTLERPFGRSRINRAIMAITDSAIRQCLRSEITSEFAAAPQKYLLGADDDTFSEKSKWEAYIGSIFALTTNEEGEIPQFGQLPQISMQPHTERMRDLAALFAGESSVPISSLGIIHDNPSSAEAMYAAKEDMVILANNMNRCVGKSLKTMGLMALATKKDVSIDSLSEEERSIMPTWHNPAMPSAVSQSDAVIKQVSAFPFMTDSDVALEELGYSEDKIARLRADREKFQAREVLEAARLRADQAAQAEMRTAEKNSTVNGVASRRDQMASQRVRGTGNDQ